MTRSAGTVGIPRLKLGRVPRVERESAERSPTHWRTRSRRYQNAFSRAVTTWQASVDPLPLIILRLAKRVRARNGYVSFGKWTRHPGTLRHFNEKVWRKVEPCGENCAANPVPVAHCIRKRGSPFKGATKLTRSFPSVDFGPWTLKQRVEHFGFFFSSVLEGSPGQRVPATLSL